MAVPILRDPAFRNLVLAQIQEAKIGGPGGIRRAGHRRLGAGINVCPRKKWKICGTGAPMVESTKRSVLALCLFFLYLLEDIYRSMNFVHGNHGWDRWDKWDIYGHIMILLYPCRSKYIVYIVVQHYIAVDRSAKWSDSCSLWMTCARSKCWPPQWRPTAPNPGCKLGVPTIYSCPILQEA